jgi:hypothetical protein
MDREAERRSCHIAQCEEEFIAEDFIDFMQYIQLSHNTVYTFDLTMPRGLPSSIRVQQ